jgi:hypothetical protein
LLLAFCQPFNLAVFPNCQHPDPVAQDASRLQSIDIGINSWTGRAQVCCDDHQNTVGVCDCGAVFQLAQPDCDASGHLLCAALFPAVSELQEREGSGMASVFLIGLGEKIAEEISDAVWVEHHTIVRRPHTINMSELLHAGIVFAGGPSQIRLSLVRRLRLSFPALPIVVVAETAETGEWLDALEAGVTDYCFAPSARRQIQRLMEWLMPVRLDGLSIYSPRQWPPLWEREARAHAIHTAGQF